MKRHAVLPHSDGRRLSGTDPPACLRSVLVIQEEQVFLTESDATIRSRILDAERSIHSVARATGRLRTTIKTYQKNPENTRYCARRIQTEPVV